MLPIPCLFLGDSIPQGVGAAYNAIAGVPCRIVARQGTGSREISHRRSVPAEPIGTTVLSIGSNDDPCFPGQLAANAVAIRSRIRTGQAIWILPYNRANTEIVRQVAASFGDAAIDLARQPTRDQLRPDRARPLSLAVMTSAPVHRERA